MPDPADTDAARNLAENIATAVAESPEDPFAEMNADIEAAIAGEEPAAEPEKEEPAKEEPEKVEPEKEEPEKEEPEKDPFEDEKEEEAPANLSEASKADWTKLRTEAKEARAAEQTAAKELAELREQLAELPELREKAAFVEEAEKQLAITNVERTKDFIATIKDPLDRLEEEALVIAKDTEVNTDQLFSALIEADPAKRRGLLKAVTADMDSVDQTEVMRIARDTRTLLEKKDEVLANAAEAAKEAKGLEEQRSAAEKAKAAKEFEASTAHTVGELATKMDFDNLVKGADADKVAEWLEGKVKEIPFDEAPLDRKTFSVAAGILLPKVNKQLAEAREEIETLKARITGENKKRPKTGPVTAEGEDPEADLPIEQQIAKFYGTSHQEADILKQLASGG